jgi:hypothetical protein
MIYECPDDGTNVWHIIVINTDGLKAACCNCGGIFLIDTKGNIRRHI